MTISKVLVLVALVACVAASAQAEQTLTEGHDLQAQNREISEHWQRKLAEVSSEAVGVLPTLTSSFEGGVDDVDDVGRDLLKIRKPRGGPGKRPGKGPGKGPRRGPGRRPGKPGKPWIG